MTDHSKTAIELIAEERARQMAVEGYDATHDDEHKDGSLAMAAVCYASPERVYVARECAIGMLYRDPWPWNERCDRRPRNGNVLLMPLPYSEQRLKLLVKAGALIAAEIDRVLRKRAEPLRRCAADRDGDCNDHRCPQLRDGEPARSGRHCPLDTMDDEER